MFVYSKEPCILMIPVAGQAMLWCAVNGVGLALVIPCIQSLIADYNPAEKRGSAFGLMFFISSMGAPLLQCLTAHATETTRQRQRHH